MQKKKIVQIPNFWTAVYNTVYDTHQRHMNDWNKCDSNVYGSSFPTQKKKGNCKIYLNFHVFIHNCDVISHKLDLVFHSGPYL